MILAGVFDRTLDQELLALNLSSEQQRAAGVERSKLAGAELSAAVFGDKLGAVRRGVELAFVRGFRAVMASAAALALLGGLSAFWLLRPDPGRKP